MLDQELDRYWKTVVNTIRDGIMIVNTRGTMVSVNRAFEKITGYTREELIGQTCMLLDCDTCNIRNTPRMDTGASCSARGKCAPAKP